MSASPLFGEMRRKAMRERVLIICQVMMADDSIRTVQFGPRGGWRFVK